MDEEALTTVSTMSQLPEIPGQNLYDCSRPGCGNWTSTPTGFCTEHGPAPEDSVRTSHGFLCPTFPRGQS